MKKDIYYKVRPYRDDELPMAINRMLTSTGFIGSLINFVPDIPLNILIRKIRKTKTCFDFQKDVFAKIISTFQERSIDNFTVSGYDKLDKNKACLFVANHRDIIMDSALMQVYLLSLGIPPCLSGIGDNLLSAQIFVDVAKVCNMFTIIRSGTARDVVTSSKLVSDFIRHTICNEKKSVWIAQRNGRTKDGIDKTQASVLKMLCMGTRNQDVFTSIKELNIVPLTISYEFEPCDNLKARELALTEKNKKYTKTQGEDYRSMRDGIFAYKGRVHLAFGKSINDSIDSSIEFQSDNERYQYVCSLIDKQMYQNYRLWPNNHIAYDMLNDCEQFQNYYSEFSKRDFIKHLRKQSNVEDISYIKMRQYLLQIYANPVKSFWENNKD
ncbi:MAG: 1-acyl-sn-glycerol-3-phosphate acyltransferase [Lentimicrobiaceae bacterium]|nr:1-acyl-sn-glycerol-3-phosphate acyltransferase [Lentimicrobiaceae bacterium]